MGKILCLDFEDECKTFVTGSNLGWIGIWDIPERSYRRGFPIVDPATKRAEPMDMIRDIAGESILITYCYKTQHLLLVQDAVGEGYSHHGILNPKVQLLGHNSKSKGNVTSLKVESGLQHLLATFENGSVSIWNLRSGSIEHEISPPQRPSGRPFAGSIFIDEFCTYMAYLTENKKAIEFYSMCWDHDVLKIEKVAQPPPSSRAAKRKGLATRLGRPKPSTRRPGLHHEVNGDN